MIIRYLGYLRRYRGPRRKNGRNYGRRNNRPETTEHPRVDKLRERIQTRAELSIELPSVEDNEESRFLLLLLLLLLLSRCSQKNCGSLPIGTVSGEFNPLPWNRILSSPFLFFFFSVSFLWVLRILYFSIYRNVCRRGLKDVNDCIRSRCSIFFYFSSVK